jgi:hypothetical protein
VTTFVSQCGQRGQWSATPFILSLFQLSSVRIFDRREKREERREKREERREKREERREKREERREKREGKEEEEIDGGPLTSPISHTAVAVVGTRHPATARRSR